MEESANLTDELDTPVVTVDLDVVDHNIGRLQSYCDQHEIRLRPHIKTHKSAQIARRQLEYGAVGITCQKLGEAEVMADAGCDDILISFPLVGSGKVERLVQLARRARISTVADSQAVASGLSRAAERASVDIRLLIECDTGNGRTGVQTPEAAARLAALVEHLPGLTFAGFMAYPIPFDAPDWLAAARDAALGLGIGVEEVSVGGTPGAFRTHEIAAVTELRPGTYVYGDRACFANGTATIDECAARVRATVVSRPTADRAVLDAGSKTLSSDPVLGVDERGFGCLVGYPEAVINRLSEEHGMVDVGNCPNAPEVGEQVEIIPNHVCVTINLHDSVLAHRAGAVPHDLPVSARGAVR